MQIVQIRAFVAMCNVAMTVCAIQQEQLPALRGMPVNSANCAAASMLTDNETELDTTFHAAQIDGNRVHFSDFRLKFIRALLG